MSFAQKFLKIVFIIFCLALVSCRSNSDLDALKSEILDFHKKFIADHLNKNIDSFLQDYSDDYVFVTNGEIRHRSKEEMRSSFSDYLNNTTFTEYKDLQEPIIGVSDDGSMAWSIVRVRVAGNRKTDDGSARDFDTTFACDDRAARREAGLTDVKLTGTLGILQKALKHKVIKLNEGNFFLAKMIETGFYSPVKSLKKI